MLPRDTKQYQLILYNTKWYCKILNGKVLEILEHVFLLFCWDGFTMDVSIKIRLNVTIQYLMIPNNTKMYWTQLNIYNRI